MQRYIKQLIDDIRRATWNLRPPHKIWKESEADPDHEPELEDLSYVEKYLYGDKEPIGAITGISAELLPPAEKLSIEQQALLSGELEKLLQYFHFYLDFPNNYPSHLKYPYICNFWQEEQVALSFGENHIEFCNYDEEQCPFPGYCDICRETAEQIKFDEEHSGKEDFDVEIDDILPN